MNKGFTASWLDEAAAIHANVQTVQLSYHNSLAVVKTKIELDSDADKCVVGDHFLVVHGHNRAVNVFGYNTKAGSKHACIVNAVVAYTEPKTGQVVILLINQAIEMKGLDHHPLCPMQCFMNGVMIDEVSKFLAPVPSETTHAIQLENPFDATHPIIIPFRLKRVTSYYVVRMP